MTKELDYPVERAITATELNQLQNFVTTASSGLPRAINTGNLNASDFE